MKIFLPIILLLASIACTVSSASTVAERAPTDTKTASTVTAKPANTPQNAHSAIVSNSGGLNVRQCPSTSCSVLVVIFDNTAVLLTGKVQTVDGTDWQPVTVGTVSGYVNARYLEVK